MPNVPERKLSLGEKLQRNRRYRIKKVNRVNHRQQRVAASRKEKRRQAYIEKRIEDNYQLRLGYKLRDVLRDDGAL